MKSSFQLGKIMGIPIGINYSWFAIFLLITVALAQYFFPEFYPGWSTPAYWIAGLFSSLLFFASLIVHELAHSFVAVRRGIEVKSITLFIFGGAARISREAASPGTELFMALAGPLSSVALAGLFALIWLLGENTSEPVAATGFYLFLTNLALAVFNMLPGLPLDGGRVLRSIIWWRGGNYRRATRVATFTGQALGGLLVMGGVVVAILVYWFNGLWLAFLGGFIYLAAWASQRQGMLRNGVQGLTARDLMKGDCQEVPAKMSLETLDNEYLLPGGHHCVLVGGKDGLAGVITPRDLKLVPKRRWSTTPVAEIMVPVERIGVVYPDDDGLTVVERMGEKGADVLLVMSADTVVGVIERDHLQVMSRARWESGA